jgi:hypothetical protein
MENLNKEIQERNEKAQAIFESNMQFVESKLKVYRNRLKYGMAFKENPFVVHEGKIILEMDKTNKLKNVGSTEWALYNTNTSEIQGTNILYRNHEIDSNKFVKLYVGQMQLLFDLTKPAQKLIQFIITELKPNQDEVFIYVPDAQKFCQWKARNQYYTAIKELVNKEIIAQSMKDGWFFVNPTVVFNGDRFMVIDRYQKKQSNQIQLPL